MNEVFEHILKKHKRVILLLDNWEHFKRQTFIDKCLQHKICVVLQPSNVTGAIQWLDLQAQKDIKAVIRQAFG